jgi:hypothetical protein
MHMFFNSAVDIWLGASKGCLNLLPDATVRKQVSDVLDLQAQTSKAIFQMVTDTAQILGAEPFKAASSKAK